MKVPIVVDLKGNYLKIKKAWLSIPSAAQLLELFLARSWHWH